MLAAAGLQLATDLQMSACNRRHRAAMSLTTRQRAACSMVPGACSTRSQRYEQTGSCAKVMRLVNMPVMLMAHACQRAYAQSAQLPESRFPTGRSGCICNDRVHATLTARQRGEQLRLA